MESGRWGNPVDEWVHLMLGRGYTPFGYDRGSEPVPLFNAHQYDAPEAGPTRNFAWSPSWLFGREPRTPVNPYYIPLPTPIQRFVDWALRDQPTTFVWHPLMQQRQAEIWRMQNPGAKYSVRGERIEPMPRFQAEMEILDSLMSPMPLPEQKNFPGWFAVPPTGYR